jgi:hypothetical protein
LCKVAITPGLRKLKNTASELEKKLRYVFAYTNVRHYEEVENMLQSVLKALAK